MKHRGTVFLYNISGTRARQIGLLCARLGFAVRPVDKAQYGLKLGALTGISGFDPEARGGAGDDFDDEMLLLKDFDNQTLDALLSGFRTMKIPRVDLKAVMTPANCEWTSFRLHDAISEEHETIKKQTDKKLEGGKEHE